MTIKILHVVQIMSCGGIERLILTMLNQKPENSFAFVLQNSKNQSIQNWPLLSQYQDRLFFADLEKNGKKKTITYLRHVCKKLGITSIHTHYTGPLLFTYLATLGFKNINFIHTEHDVWHLSDRKARWIEKVIFFCKQKIHLVAISKQIREALTLLFPRQQASLIYNGVDTSHFKPGNRKAACSYFGLPDSITILGCAGRLVSDKGHRYLIAALKELPDHFHLAIAGDGVMLEELIKYSHQLGVQNRISFLGFIENMNLFYQACHIFCLPSLNEGLPNTLLEAQAINIPVICSDVGGCKEAVDPNSGVMVEPKNVQAIAQACLKIVKEDVAPREFILKKFSLETFLASYDRLYQGS